MLKIDLRLANLDIDNYQKIYEVSKFPDGQQDVWVDPCIAPSARKNGVIIYSNFNSMLDLELIACTKAALNELDINHVELFIPYFLGARSDRKFKNGGTWYLRDVICPMVNSLNFKKVTVVDPHSNVLGNLVKNINIITNLDHVSKALLYDYNIGISIDDISNDKIHNELKDKCIISPDAGAEHKIQDLAKSLRFPGEVVSCYKARNMKGEITKTIVTRDDFEGRDCYIIDDICDGGRTFIELAKELQKRNCGKLYLIVTHGIFSKGVDVLREHFNRVYCTNSIKEIRTDDYFLIQFDIFKHDV